jgi:methionyl aminopeptidase
MSLIKSPQQIQLMREGGKILTEALNSIHAMIKPGVDVWDLETYFINFCKTKNVEPACKGYTAEGNLPPFPTGLCVYVNEQSVHCFPKKGVILRDNDVVTIDTVIKYKNMYVDAAFAKGVGQTTKDTDTLLRATKEALLVTEKLVKPDVRIGELSHTMQRFVEANRYNVLRDYAGHGIGTEMHEDPEVPCYGQPDEGMKLKPGMTICIEALVSEGKPNVHHISEWESVMRDGKRFLQFEHTILVTDNGYEVLTPLSV